ncbi:partial Protein DipZ, partial [Patescibacteria group bacterium]
MKNIRSFSWLSPQTMVVFILLCAFFFPGGMSLVSAQKKRMPAPELAGGTAWLNVSKPLTLADLKGKVVLLDFWTYC